MPRISTPISPRGPIIDVAVCASAPRVKALLEAGQDVPPPQDGLALIDTGASCTVVDFRLLASLELQPRGTTRVHTASTGTTGESRNVYDISLVVYMNDRKTHVIPHTIAAVEADLQAQGIDVLIGRDVLAEAVLIYDGAKGELTLMF